MGKSSNPQVKLQSQLLIPNGTAFIANFCIMVLELTAARLIARHLGVSLFTWTSVIGVVLGGIALGNYIGGKIADHFPSQKVLSLLFILSSMACLTIPVLNQLTGDWIIFVSLSWPVRTILHVAIIFLFPSTLLGMISPVVAKFALDQGFGTGHTVGDVYAWGAIGSIVGTFLTGFFLIATMGTVKVIWALAVILAIMGILYRKGFFLPYLWLGILTVLAFFALSSQSWALIGKPIKENVIYTKDSQYSYVVIKKSKQNPWLRTIVLDDLTQSYINIDEPTNLDYAYPYCQTFAKIVKHFKPEGRNFSMLNLGGGGYTFPRYVEAIWPESHIEVVEIDPVVTKAAQKFFNLSKESNIIIHHMDARNYIEDLIRSKQTGRKSTTFDFILLDVFTGSIAIPYHLVTDEFNQKIAQVLTADGLYAINLIDFEASPRFLKSMIKTLKNTFSDVNVILPGEKSIYKRNKRSAYVLIASKNKFNQEALESSQLGGRRLNMVDLKIYLDNVPGVSLTDDFSPTEILLKKAFARRGRNRLFNKILDKGVGFSKKKEFDKAMAQYERILRVDPEFPGAHVNIGSLQILQDKDDQAIRHYNKALKADPEFKPALAGLGNVYEKNGFLDKAVEMYRKVIAMDPNISQVYVMLGNVLHKQNKFDEAIKNYQKALTLEPKLVIAQKNLSIALKNKTQMEKKGEIHKPKTE